MFKKMKCKQLTVRAGLLAVLFMVLSLFSGSLSNAQADDTSEFFPETGILVCKSLKADQF